MALARRSKKQRVKVDNMTLHEAIKAILKENNRPMAAKDIASAINLQGVMELIIWSQQF